MSIEFCNAELENIEDRIVELQAELGVLLRRRAELLFFACGTSPSGSDAGSRREADGRARGGERHQERRKTVDVEEEGERAVAPHRPTVPTQFIEDVSISTLPWSPWDGIAVGDVVVFRGRAAVVVARWFAAAALELTDSGEVVRVVVGRMPND